MKKAGKGIVLLLCALSLVCFAGCDSQDYKSALDLMENGQWSEAKEVFISLENYKDSAAMLTECNYNIALEVMESGDHNSAAELFDALGKYKDSADMAAECRYLSASALMESGEYEAAIEKFTAIGDYKDSAELLTECRYQHAVALYEDDDAKGALAIFETLEDYKDSSRYVVICSLLGDPYGFVDEFAAAMDATFKKENIPCVLSANDSYGYDERTFQLVGEDSTGETSVIFANITSGWDYFRNGQINGVIIAGSAEFDPDVLVQSYIEVVTTGAMVLNLLDDTASFEDLRTELSNELTMLMMEGYPETDEPTHYNGYELEYKGYECLLAMSDMGGDFTRFLFSVRVPELVTQ